jgi:predicted nucleic acid-binding protein
VRVLVDTSIWSLALRRSGEPAAEERSLIDELNGLIDDVRVAMIGPIRQELLSGIPSQAQFEALKEKLQAFDDLPLGRDDHERASGFYNTCRRSGVQGSQTDLLICAAGAARGLPIFTSDKDFVLYARHLPISLHSPAGAAGA